MKLSFPDEWDSPFMPDFLWMKYALCIYTCMRFNSFPVLKYFHNLLPFLHYSQVHVLVMREEYDAHVKPLLNFMAASDDDEYWYPHWHDDVITSFTLKCTVGDPAYFP